MFYYPGFYQVGGYQGMVDKYPAAIATKAILTNSTCNMPRKDYMNLFRDPVTGDLPWPGLVGVMINSLWYWCADQVPIIVNFYYINSKLSFFECRVAAIVFFFAFVK